MFTKSKALKLIAVTGFLCASLVTAQASGGTYISPTGGDAVDITSTPFTWNFPTGYSGDVQGFILRLEGNLYGESQLQLTLYDNSNLAGISVMDSSGYDPAGGNPSSFTPITFDFEGPVTLVSSDVYTATLTLYKATESDGSTISVQTGDGSTFGGTSDAPEPGSLSMIGIGVFALLAGHKWSKK